MTRGVHQILRFNWPLYLIGATVATLAASVLAVLPIPAALRGVAYLPPVLALFWMAASLVASWEIYDRSPLMRWQWIPRALGDRPHAWISIHAGLDESSSTLRALLGPGGRVFDIFDPAAMTEPSIARARRRIAGASGAEAVDFRRLPAAAASVDAVLVLLSAHELRSHDARGALFQELHRILTSDGRVVVAEHLRDRANFAAFGPGFLHFHSRRTWMRCFAEARFGVDKEFSITPFVRVFVLERQA